MSSSSESKGFDSHLPGSFLYRHAIELYLKAGIIIFHRKFALPWGEDGCGDEPKVPVGGKWKAMYNFHGLELLHGRLSALFAEHADYLRDNTEVDWSLPAEFKAWIAQIEATDGSSTFFRYPVTKHAAQDAEKSPSKESSVAGVFARFGPAFPPQRAFFVLNQEDEIVQSFYRDETQTDALLDLLRKTSDCLYGLHAALRGELTGGW